MKRFEITPRGPFSLAQANRHFGGWPAFEPDPVAIPVTFPMEGWQTSAAVIMRQASDGTVSGEVHGADDVAEQAWQQALATVSLDLDGSGWPTVGERDPVIGGLQRRYDWIRPVLFHSPYEAAAAFVIGHRISIQQGREIRKNMARELGDAIAVDGTVLHAFPRPDVLRELTGFKSVSAEKVERLHTVARAALDGLLDRRTLREMPNTDALAQLQTLRGIGPFFAQAILFRGAGFTDTLTDEPIGKQAIQWAYGLPEMPDQHAVTARAQMWRPYRMWSTVLLHLAFRSEGLGQRRSAGRPTAYAAH